LSDANPPLPHVLFVEVQSNLLFLLGFELDDGVTCVFSVLHVEGDAVRGYRKACEEFNHVVLGRCEGKPTQLDTAHHVFVSHSVATPDIVWRFFFQIKSVVFFSVYFHQLNPPLAQSLLVAFGQGALGPLPRVKHDASLASFAPLIIELVFNRRGNNIVACKETNDFIICGLKRETSHPERPIRVIVI